MEKRPIKELLILLKEEMIKGMLEKINISSHGICFYIIRLRFNDEINAAEYVMLYRYIQDNKPNKETHKEFAKNELYQDSSVYFWKPILFKIIGDNENNKELEIRLKFLDRLIELA